MSSLHEVIICSRVPYNTFVPVLGLLKVLGLF